MGQYMMGLLGVPAVMGVMENILPSGAKSAAYLKFMSCLCLLCLALRPLSAVLEDLPALVSGRVEQLADQGEEKMRFQYESILAGQLESVVRQELVEAIGQKLEAMFSVGTYEVGVDLLWADTGWTLRQVVITLMGKDILKNPHAIEAYFYEWLDCECIVVIG